mgnify:CR=1 FL=1
MAFPYDAYRPGQGAPYLKGLKKYVEKPASDAVRKKDNEATVRNFGGDRAAIDEATEGK